jgi:hypothetical protein
MGYLCSNRQTVSTALIALAFFSGWSACAWAVQRDYTITTNSSSIAISGSVTALGTTASIQPQGTGGLTTNYSGTIKTDRGANSVTFQSGSTIDANTNGTWRPLADGGDGAALADYGGKSTFFFVIVVNFAGRNFIGGLTSGVLPVDGTNHFDLSTTNVTFSSGSIAYRNESTGDPATSRPIVGQGGALSGTGTLSSLVQGAQTTETLTIPISSSFQIVDASTTINLTLTGQLLATSTFATPLPGDYNQNGVVDAADYVRYRNNFGSGTSLPNDDTVGVGTDDYTRWRTNFGQTYGSGSGETLLFGSSVPEASSVILLLTAAVVGCIHYCRRVTR